MGSGGDAAISRTFDDFIVTALVLPTARDRDVLSEFADMDNLQVVFGDLTDYSVVEACVRGTDVVLHVGAIVSPLADREPELANRVNVGGMTNIVRAVKAQPDPNHIAVIGIGSVAETGSRNEPITGGGWATRFKSLGSMSTRRAR